MDVSAGPSLVELVKVQAERCKSLTELCQMSLYFYTDTIEYDEDAVKKHLRPVVLDPLVMLYERLKGLNVWQADTIQESINEVCLHFDINMGKIAQPVRVAVTGAGMSPSIDATLALLGKERTLSRIEVALEEIRVRAASV